MEDELKAKIITHLDTSPIKQNEVNEMKKEWKDLKTRLTTIIFIVVGSMFAYGVWVGNLQTHISHLDQEYLMQQKKLDSDSLRLSSLEINNGEIKTKLVNIEATLQEIKVSIGKIK